MGRGRQIAGFQGPGEESFFEELRFASFTVVRGSKQGWVVKC